MKKLLLCVGAAKAGTTWLYKRLERNPALHFSQEKEINYFFSRYGAFNRLRHQDRVARMAWFIERARRRFGDDLTEEQSVARFGPFHRSVAWYARYADGVISDEWYRGLFFRAREDQFHCDFSPSTSLISDEGWRSVASFADEVKIIYILRRPDERLWSHAKFHAKFIGAFDRFARMPASEMHEMIERDDLLIDGDYGDHLAALSRHVPPQNVLLLDFDRIAAAPRETLDKVAAFLRLPPIPAPDEMLAERNNASPELRRPRGFGAPYAARFEAQTRSLVEQGVDFAKGWLR